MLHHGHFVQFFDSEECRTDTVSQYFADALRCEHSCIMLATAAHRDLIGQRLLSMGFALDELQARYQFVALDAATMLRRFTVDAQPDRFLFHGTIGLLVRQVAASGRPISIYGEMLALLDAAGQHAAILQVEEFWNELSRQENFTLFCGYSQSSRLSVDGATHLCSAHTAVLTQG